MERLVENIKVDKESETESLSFKESSLETWL